MQHNLSFNRKNKIKKKSEIQNLIKKCKRLNFDDFSILYTHNELKNDRVAVLVSRKIGNAIKRNKFKRFFREIFRKDIKRDPPFFDILIQIRPGINIHNKSEYEICFRQWIKESKTN